jgi:hypothetical protein
MNGTPTQSYSTSSTPTLVDGLTERQQTQRIIDVIVSALELTEDELDGVLGLGNL